MHKSKISKVRKAGKPNTSNKDPLCLESVFGLNVSNSCGIICVNGILFYAAGCVVVLYKESSNHQLKFFKCSKAISSITVSLDGKFLAAGERGHLPNIYIWDVASGEKISNLTGHEYGIGSLSFSTNGHYLVSVGFKYDKQIIFWEWLVERKISEQKVSNKVHKISFNDTGEFFVTCGDRHLKWWYIVRGDGGEVISVYGKPGTILDNLRNSIFVDAICGKDTFEDCVYSCTSSGILCMFQESRVMEKWIQLDSSSAYSLTQTPDRLFVGCANGIIRCFSSSDLTYLFTLPLPSALPSPSSLTSFPACYALAVIESGDGEEGGTPTKKLASVYADRSLYIWNLFDTREIGLDHSFQYHHGCIWDLQLTDVHSQHQASPLPPGSFVTCATDNSIRFWNLNPQSQKKSQGRVSSQSLSGPMLHRINIRESQPSKPSKHRGSSASSIHASVDSQIAPLDLCSGLPDLEIADKPQFLVTPRCLAIHPNGRELVTGDRDGQLTVYDIESMAETARIKAHEAEILTVHYSPPLRKFPSAGGGSDGQAAVWEVDLAASSEPAEGLRETSPLVLLVSSGRDRLIHVFDASSSRSMLNPDIGRFAYKPITVLDHHSSSVTTVKFTPDGSRLISCGGDKAVVFASVNGPNIQRFKTVMSPKGNINGLAMVGTTKFAVTSGQDKRLNIWNTQTGKIARAYSHDRVSGELYKCDTDPAGMYIATCSLDKTIRLFDYFSGSQLAQVSGHSEPITCLRFSLNGKYLLSASGDGCIFVWRLHSNLVKAMKERLFELYSRASQMSSLASRIGSLGEEEDPSEGQAAVESKATEDAAESADRTDGQPRRRLVSKWSERIESSGGYELFGRRISPRSRDRRKLTLELSQGVRLEHIDGIHNANLGSRVDGDRDGDRDEVGSMERDKARTMEADDAVVVGDESDINDIELCDEHQRRQRGETEDSVGEEEEEDLVERGDEELSEEGDLDRTQERLDSLEESVQKLENWLDEQLRQDNLLDESVSDILERSVQEKSIGSGVGDSLVDLNRSLSSAFFQDASKNKHNSQQVEPPLPSPPPHTRSGSDRELHPNTDQARAVLETKRKETAAAVAQMRMRLQAMGIFTLPGDECGLVDSENRGTDAHYFSSSPGEKGETPLGGLAPADAEEEDSVPDTDDELVDQEMDSEYYVPNSDASTVVFPPPPPSYLSEATRASGFGVVAANHTTPAVISEGSSSSREEPLTVRSVPEQAMTTPPPPQTTSLFPDELSNSGQLSASNSFSTMDTRALRERSLECREALRELLAASAKAQRAFEALSQARISSSFASNLSAISTFSKDTVDSMDSVNLTNSEINVENGDDVSFADETLSQYMREWSRLQVQVNSSFQNANAIVLDTKSTSSESFASPRPPDEARKGAGVTGEVASPSHLVLDSNPSDAVISSLLDKYADRLLDLVSDKVARKLKSDENSSEDRK